MKPLSEKQLQAVDLLASGISKSEVAKIVGVDRATIYLWGKNNKNFRFEVDRQTKENKENIDKMIMTYADSIVTEVYQLAMKAKSEKVRLDACQYLLNRVAGTPTTKTEIKQVEEEKEEKKELTWDDLNAAVNRSNVIDISISSNK